jgi:hypothetical protein
MNDPLTFRQMSELQALMPAVQGCRPVRWLVDDTNVLCEGTARAITHIGGGFLNADEDIRDGFVWISGTMEHWLPVREVMAKISKGEFAID